MLPVAAFSKVLKKRTGCFFFPSVKHCSISCWCTNQHKLSWVNRVHVISSKSGNLWGFSLYPQGLTASFAEVRDELIQEGRRFVLLRNR